MESDPKSDASPAAATGSPPPSCAAGTYAQVPPPGRRGLAILLLNAVFAFAAFGSLVTFNPEPTLEAEFEGVFFTPSDTSPSVVLLLAAWLLYRRRDRLARLPIDSGSVWLAGMFFAVSAAILTWATLVDVTDLRVPALMAVILALAALAGGRQAIRAVALPTAFLLFAMPMPAPLLNATLFRMQFWTADFAGAILHAVGTPAFVTGDQILRGEDHFAIIETCSGVRIVETLTILTILMLDLFRRRGLHSLILLALAPGVAFLMNGLRAVTLILNPHADISEIHTLQGIAMLLGGVLALYAFDGLLARVLPAAVRAPSPPAPPAGRAVRIPRWKWLSATAALAALAVITLAVKPWSREPRMPRALLTGDFQTLDGWDSSELRVDRRFLGRIGLWRDLHRRYVKGPDVVNLYAAVGEREFRPRSVLFSKAELPGSGWNTREQGVLRLDPGGIEARWRIVASGTSRFFVVYWTEAGGSLWEESLRSLLGLDLSPFRRPGEAMAIRLATPMIGTSERDREQVEARIRRFYAVLRVELDEQHAILGSGTG